MKILALHGINLNMFGKRDPKQYGTITLAEIDAKLKALGKELGAVGYITKPVRADKLLSLVAQHVAAGAQPQ